MIYSWYVLLASFFILPLTWEVTSGCTLLLVGSVDESIETFEGFGIFKQAYYDPEDGKFLGCIDYSKSWLEETNDLPWTVGRIAGIIMAVFSTISCIICLTIQCFSKHGKTRFWSLMRFTYFLAFGAQGTIFYLYFADICESYDGDESMCRIGSNGIAAIANTVFLFGMVIASCCSLPPRNPVFKLWTSSPNYDTDQADSYDDEEGVEGDDVADDMSSNGSVSLFGSVKSFKSKKSNTTQSVVSKAPPGLHSIVEDKEAAEPIENTDANSLVESIKNRTFKEDEKSTSGASVSASMVSFRRHAKNHFEHDVELGPGGVRVDETQTGNLIIVVDEYPATGEIVDGSDMVKIRSEYCKLGRKSIREEFHKDGSRTVKTTITILRDDSVIAAIDP